MIYNLSDKINPGKYFNQYDPSKVSNYYVYGKITETLDCRSEEIRLLNSDNYLYLKCGDSYDTSTIEYGKIYVLEIESNAPNIPTIKRVLYNVTDKIWYV